MWAEQKGKQKIWGHSESVNNEKPLSLQWAKGINSILEPNKNWSPGEAASAEAAGIESQLLQE